MIRKIENEVKLVLSNETQAKFTPNVSSAELNSFLGRLKELFKFAGFEVNHEKSVKNVDHYFDTERNDLNHSQHSFRVRENANGMVYTIKKPLDNGISLQRREEIEGPIANRTEYENLANSNFSKIFDEHLIDFSGLPIRESAIIHNDRRQFGAVRNDERYTVCVDLVKFLLPNSKVASREEVELEIEAESDEANEKIDELKRYFLGIFPEFTYSHKSKFGRACDFLDRYRTNWLYKLIKSYKDHAIISATITVIGVVGSVFSIFGFFK